MLNDWTWEKVDDAEMRLKDSSGKLISYIVRTAPGLWYCRLYNDDCYMHSGVALVDMKSAEEAMWQATLWINKECNRVAKSFHRIRNHLPRLHELRIASEEKLR